MKCSLGISNLLEEISSLSHSTVCSISLHCSHKAFLSLLAVLWNSAFSWVYLSLSTLVLASSRASTFAASAATVAGKPHPATPALRAKVRSIKLFLRDRPAPFIGQLKLDGLSLKTKPGFECLFTLQTVSFDLIELSVFDKPPARTAEDKGDIIRETFIPQGVKVIHIEVQAAFTALSAAMPRIPYIVQEGHLSFCFLPAI